MIDQIIPLINQNPQVALQMITMGGIAYVIREQLKIKSCVDKIHGWIRGHSHESDV